jgi:hypothetical protein
MKSIRIVLVAVLVTATASIASAQFKRTFVSAQLGNDANNCGPTTPCRNFLRAITAVDPGGEVVVLDSGGYGPFTVTKAVTVQAPSGVYAGCTQPTGTAVTINAGPSDTVVIRGLSLNGLSSGATGIDFAAGAVLHIENVVVNGFTTTGIQVAHASQLFVNDTLVRNGGGNGITVQGATASLSRCRLEKNGGAGLVSDNGATVVGTETVSAGNNRGFFAFTAGTTMLTLENCVASGNTEGVSAGGGAGALARVSNSTITNNGTGVVFGGGASLLTRTNNLVEGNTTDGTFSGSFAAK